MLPAPLDFGFYLLLGCISSLTLSLFGLITLGVGTDWVLLLIFGSVAGESPWKLSNDLSRGLILEWYYDGSEV